MFSIGVQDGKIWAHWNDTEIYPDTFTTEVSIVSRVRFVLLDAINCKDIVVLLTRRLGSPTSSKRSINETLIHAIRDLVLSVDCFFLPIEQVSLSRYSEIAD